LAHDDLYDRLRPACSLLQTRWLFARAGSYGRSDAPAGKHADDSHFEFDYEFLWRC